MLSIIGEEAGDYFDLICKTCGGLTENEYLGGDPTVPHFLATCNTCKTSGKWKLSFWTGLPLTAENPRQESPTGVAEDAGREERGE